MENALSKILENPDKIVGATRIGKEVLLIFSDGGVETVYPQDPDKFINLITKYINDKEK